MFVRVNVHETKANLSRYLERVENGEVVVLCKRNRPVAELRRLPRREQRPARVLGLCAGTFQVGPEFFEPLPANMMKAFDAEQS